MLLALVAGLAPEPVLEVLDADRSTQNLHSEASLAAPLLKVVLAGTTALTHELTSTIVATTNRLRY